MSVRDGFADHEEERDKMMKMSDSFAALLDRELDKKALVDEVDLRKWAVDHAVTLVKNNPTVILDEIIELAASLENYVWSGKP